MARNCGPYKKIIDYICSILLWLLEAWVPQGCLGCCLAASVAWLPEAAGPCWVLGLEVCSLKTPVAETCGPYKKIIVQIHSILPWPLEA